MTTSIRYYQSTLAYTTRERSKKIRDMKKHIRTRISRRRARKTMQHALHLLHLSF